MASSARFEFADVASDCIPFGVNRKRVQVSEMFVAGLSCMRLCASS